jgi:3-oxoacyl-[acyl-carrier-protein] synthase III
VAFLSATARYLPPRVVHNRELVQFPEELREMIAAKAGIHTRHVADGECTSDLGAKAVRALIDKCSLDVREVNALICATSSPDRMQPATATRIQHLCGLKDAFAFDVNSVCSGGVYALRLASALIKDGLNNVIVVASEVYSKILNPEDISTFPYFGDGAAACLVSRAGAYELVDFGLQSDGSGCEVIQVPAGGTMSPAALVKDSRDYYFRMIGRKVFDFAAQRGTEMVRELSSRNNLVPDRIVLHQANVNIIREIAKRSELPPEKFFINVDRYANTAGASVLIALDELLEGDADPESVLLCAFGGGLSWGGALLRKAEKPTVV